MIINIIQLFLNYKFSNLNFLVFVFNNLLKTAKPYFSPFIHIVFQTCFKFITKKSCFIYYIVTYLVKYLLYILTGNATVVTLFTKGKHLKILKIKRFIRRKIHPLGSLVNSS